MSHFPAIPTAHQEVLDLRRPFLSGRYEVIRQVGVGATARVYLAELHELGLPVALKVAHGCEPLTEARLDHEAQVLATVRSPHVVRMIDRGRTDDGRLYLAVRYVDGPSLADLAPGLDAWRATGLVRQLLVALDAVHEAGVVHRDVKPSNVLVGRDRDGREQIKLCDFERAWSPLASPELLEVGRVVGSPHTMAPEQIQGGAVDPRTDVYAAGVVLYRLLAGRFPFHGANPVATMAAHLQAPLPELDGTDPELAAIVRQCLSRHPADRFESARHAAVALADWLARDDTPESTPVSWFRSLLGAA